MGNNSGENNSNKKSLLNNNGFGSMINFNQNHSPLKSTSNKGIKKANGQSIGMKNQNNNINNGEQQEKSKMDQVGEKVAEKAGSAAITAATGGAIPKPVADAISKKLAGPMLKASKRNLKIYILFASLPLLVLLLIFSIFLGSDDDAQQKKDNYFEGEMSDAELYEMLSQLGYCNYDECADSDAAAFYKKVLANVKSFSTDNRVYSANIIFSFIGYQRSTSEKFKHVEEIELLANALKNAGYTSDSDLSELTDFKNSVVDSDGYLDTYRYDLISKNDDKNEIYLSMVKIANEVNNQYDTYKKNKSSNNPNTGSNCVYTVDGNQQSIKVQLTRCVNSASKNTPTVGEPMDLEDYVQGVLYAESVVNGGWNIEVVKAHAVAIRSFVLSVNRNVGDATGEGLGTVQEGLARIQSCTNRQVFCSPNYGCSEESDRTMVPGTANKPLSGHFGPMSDLQQQISKQVINDTKGQVLKDSEGIKPGAYNADTIPYWKNYQSQGMDFNEILVKYYSDYYNTNITVESIGECTAGDISEYDWRQMDPRWKDVKIGGSSIGPVGCLVTSTAIQIARSGTKITSSSFDPGVLGKAMNSQGAFGSSGELLSWGANAWHAVAPNFDFLERTSAGGSKANKASVIASIISDSTKFVIVSVNSGGHWVAVTGVNGSEVSIIDPGGYNYKSLWDYSPAGDCGSIIVFQKKD